jgi:hypothetical protein
MLAVFLVVPQLQRTGRENQMKNAATRVLLAARECVSTGCDISGNSNVTAKIENYTGAINNPATNTKYTYFSTTAGAAFYADYMWISLNTKCTTSSTYTIGNSTGSIAVVYNVEPYKNNATKDGERRCISD